MKTRARVKCERCECLIYKCIYIRHLQHCEKMPLKDDFEYLFSIGVTPFQIYKILYHNITTDKTYFRISFVLNRLKCFGYDYTTIQHDRRYVMFNSLTTTLPSGLSLEIPTNMIRKKDSICKCMVCGICLYEKIIDMPIYDMAYSNTELYEDFLYNKYGICLECIRYMERLSKRCNEKDTKTNVRTIVCSNCGMVLSTNPIRKCINVSNRYLEITVIDAIARVMYPYVGEDNEYLCGICSDNAIIGNYSTDWVKGLTESVTLHDVLATDDLGKYIFGKRLLEKSL